MSIAVTMPALSPTMEKGTLAKWLVAVGDRIESGDLLAEVETDKATMEIEAVNAGRIGSIDIAEGTEDVPVGTVLATLAADGGVDPVPAVSGGDAGHSTDRRSLPDANAALVPAAPATSAARNGSEQLPHRQRPENEIGISPLAARIAEAKGIDLSGLSGSGRGGRIICSDLSAFSRAGEAHTSGVDERVTEDHASAPPPDGVPHSTSKLSGMRRTIARRLSAAKRSVPHFYLTVRCRLDALELLRSELNAELSPRGIKLSVNDLILKAMAIAMTDVLEVNVQFGGDNIYRFDRVDIAMAVAVDGGLVTPVLRDVGSLSLSAIARQTRSFATRAREGALTPEDYQGGTASLSNLGMFGIDEIVPVINPPQALILGIGAAIEQPWKVDGAVALASVSAFTGSFDHRVIDGAAGARFMTALRETLEMPLRLIA